MKGMAAEAIEADDEVDDYFSEGQRGSGNYDSRLSRRGRSLYRPDDDS